MKSSERFSPIRNRKTSAGFSMLEVLVSIVIVTMGLLALAGMSIRSLAANDSSGQRANAAIYAFYIADLMRANRQPVLDEGYDVSVGSSTVSGGSNAQSIRDIEAWKALLATLPAGDGSVDYDAGTQLARIIVQWDDSRGNMSSTETSSIRTYEYTFRP